jgi:hypothetical protein
VVEEEEVTDNKTYDKLCMDLLKHLPAEQWNKLKEDDFDLSPDFLGFIDIYFYLSKIIPKDWIVYDFGCAWATQGFYFRNHKKYIAVDNGVKNIFHFKNTEFHNCTIAEFLNHLGKQSNFKNTLSFAICSYVPDFKSAELVRQTFKNVFTIYPDTEKKIVINF